MTSAARPNTSITLDEIAEKLDVTPKTVSEADSLGLFTKVEATGRIHRLQFENEGWTSSNIGRRIREAKSDRVQTWVFSLTIAVFSGVFIGGLLGEVLSF